MSEVRKKIKRRLSSELPVINATTSQASNKELSQTPTMDFTENENNWADHSMAQEPFDVSVANESYHEIAPKRDEIKVVQQSFQSETCQVNFCRYFLTMALWVTAVLLAVSTNHSLSAKEELNFEDAYELVSNSIGRAAMTQRNSAALEMNSLSEAITMDSLQSSNEWPRYAFPFYTKQADNVRAQTGLEFLMISNLVEPSQVDNYLDFIVNGHRQISTDLHDGAKVSLENDGYDPLIYSLRDDKKLYNTSRWVYGPVWGISPEAKSNAPINFDILSIPDFEKAFRAVQRLKNETFFYSTALDSRVTEGIVGDLQKETLETVTAESPRTFIMSPIRKSLEGDAPIVGIQIGAFSWEIAFGSVLPNGVQGIFTVVSSTCGQILTYRIERDHVLFLGEGDSHDPDYDNFKRHFKLSEQLELDLSDSSAQCLYSIDVYPTFQYRKEYITDTPSKTASGVAVTLAGIVIVFFLYDLVVQRRNTRMIESVAQSSAVVSEMFPGTLGDKYRLQDTNKRMKSFLDKDGVHTEELVLSDKAPLAELFLETTVMFADIAGFTSWSSVREPAQVFMLLESIFGEFDELAKPRRIFKVETVGDCYVAVSGIPDFRKDHAVAMARFARDAVRSFRATTRKLDVVLGPDTSDLGLRVGLHSGPVTAGILRGDRARFQLFGDTMNTCSRIETTSENGRIHLSRDTADLLEIAGKQSWLIPRPEMVTAKGKGLMETFWLRDKTTDGEDTDSIGDRSSSGSVYSDDVFADDKTDRLIDWNTDTLKRYLIDIMARRRLDRKGRSEDKVGIDKKALAMSDSFLDEVQDSIQLPEFAHTHAGSKRKPPDLDVKVEQQLREYVASIAGMYRDNAFHNFEHASHVTMSVTKLLSRIVAPSDLELDMDNLAEQSQRSRRASQIKITQTLHDHTYGITGDPLTQFACAFSALIHDVDHQGVPNTQLVVEDPELGKRFRNRSVAEQNSLSIAWDLLMEPGFKNLRAAIFTTPEELVRFRELVVNCVMATDIVDKDLKRLRNGRWDKAFMKGRQSGGDDSRLTVNRRATIVIEHLLQASDVSHTMQHWHVYRKWNENLFRELFMAYKAGRSTDNPALDWAKSEIGFFDFYILPLAKKLKECGVFGISSAEYLNYAQRNREEWLRRGDEIVAQMVARYEAELAAPPPAPAARGPRIDDDAASC